MSRLAASLGRYAQLSTALAWACALGIVLVCSVR